MKHVLLVVKRGKTKDLRLYGFCEEDDDKENGIQYELSFQYKDI